MPEVNRKSTKKSNFDDEQSENKNAMGDYMQNLMMLNMMK
jgi:hypothetical protein